MACDALALKTEGNECFASGEWLRAAGAWTKALKVCQGAGDPELVATLHSNRSAAFAKLCKARQALADADAAVALRPDWDKAFYRRGVALEVRPHAEGPARRSGAHLDCAEASQGER
jgi:tetratricopeptide (TPR) repeat protein